MLIVTPTEGEPGQPSGQPLWGYGPTMQKVYRSRVRKKLVGYVKRVVTVKVTADKVDAS